MRATVLTVFVLLAWSLQAIGQSPAPPSGEQPSLAQSPAASENELKLVVALFRHGVRAPLAEFTPEKADLYSGQHWPSLKDWDVPEGKTWGDLTKRGQVLATALGSYYAQWYTKNGWPGGFKVYLWADTDQRTIDTAKALDNGFQQGGIPQKNITVKSLPTPSPTPPVDPLFHPFKAGCGTPDPKTLGQTVTDIKKGGQLWAQKLEASFKELYRVLECTAPPCVPLEKLVDVIGTCPDGKNFPRTCESPITWKGTLKGVATASATATATPTPTPPGKFPYASSASEAFLLEYANNMAPNLVGWGGVDAAKNLPSLMQLHETYFDLTERDPYLAKIQGSNLIREIRDLIRRTAEAVEPIEVNCLRADKASQFIGLVGHDTNIAGVGKLLQLSWKFDDAHLPPGEHLPSDTSNLPPNDALPAGALVFELRERAGQSFIRIDYVAQSLLQMRGDPKRPPNEPFRFNVTCPGERGTNLSPCEMPLDKFTRLVTNALGPAPNPFLSRCTSDGNQVCP
jgi:4-phytase / acid phosphatase